VTPSPAELMQVQAMQTFRVFEIRGPRQESARCIVGVTRHVEQLVLAESHLAQCDN
jgi:hypothetical protein